MKKLITLLVTIAMIGVMLTGCGGSGKEVTADPAKLAEDLSKQQAETPFLLFPKISWLPLTW